MDVPRIRLLDICMLYFIMISSPMMVFKKKVRVLKFMVYAGMAQANIDKKASPQDWRNREAATAAFGAILEGPPVARLSSYVAAGLEFLLNAMADPNQQVRHTTAWTVGKQFLHPVRYSHLAGKHCMACAFD